MVQVKESLWWKHRHIFRQQRSHSQAKNTGRQASLDLCSGNNEPSEKELNQRAGQAHVVTYFTPRWVAALTAIGASQDNRTATGLGTDTQDILAEGWLLTVSLSEQR